MNCSVCDDLREKSPTFVQNGVTTKIANNLADNKGFEGKSNNCDDLNDANDCMIGQFVEEIPSYDDCDWKSALINFVKNGYQMFKAIVASICGLWDKVSSAGDRIQCVIDGIRSIVDQINDSIGAESFTRYSRGKGRGVDYNIRPISAGDDFYFNFYTDADNNGSVDIPSAGTYGSKVADRDYIALCMCCTNFGNFIQEDVEITFYSSSDTRDISEIRAEAGQHPAIQSNAEFNDMSWPVNGQVFVKKGSYVKLNAHVNIAEGASPRLRIHQVAITWVPVNAASDSLIKNTTANC